MARMPDGWIVTVEADGLEVRLKESRELVMCKNCVFYGEEPYGTLKECYRGCGWTEPIDYCSRGKRRDSE